MSLQVIAYALFELSYIALVMVSPALCYDYDQQERVRVVTGGDRKWQFDRVFARWSWLDFGLSLRLQWIGVMLPINIKYLRFGFGL